MPRRLRYQVAASLDGFIADPNGGYDWIVNDPRIDFKALYREFDTAVMGRKTYDLMQSLGAAVSMPGIEVVAFSRTLPPKSQMFRVLLDAGLVDTVEIAVMPVLLGAGIPVLPAGAMATLTLADQKILADSGIVMLAYTVKGSRAAPPRIRYIKPRTRKTKAPKKNPSRRRR